MCSDLPDTPLKKKTPPKKTPTTHPKNPNQPPTTLQGFSCSGSLCAHREDSQHQETQCNCLESHTTAPLYLALSKKQLAKETHTQKMFTAEIAAIALPVFSLFSLGWLKGCNSTYKRIGLNKKDFILSGKEFSQRKQWKHHYMVVRTTSRGCINCLKFCSRHPPGQHPPDGGTRTAWCSWTTDFPGNTASIHCARTPESVSNTSRSFNPRNN